MIKFIDLYKQYLSIKDEVDDAIKKVIEASSFIKGEHLEEFEDNFAKYCEVKYCLGVGNGTDAIEIAIESLGLEKDSEIIVPANTFIATSEAVTRNNHKIIFADVNETDHTISLDDVERKISKKTKAIIAVHLFGHCVDMDALKKIASPLGIKIIEDAAQAHGALYKDKKVGSLGDIATFSFYPGKNLGCYGDGGAIVSNNLNLIKRCKMIANHGESYKNYHLIEGRNSRLDAIQAAILNVKLKYLDKWTERRRKISKIYDQELANLANISLVKPSAMTRSAYHLYVIKNDKRDKLRDYLKLNNIETGIHYPKALPKLESYHYLGQYDQTMIACNIDSKILSLPMSDQLTVEESQFVCDYIKKFINIG